MHRLEIIKKVCRIISVKHKESNDKMLIKGQIMKYTEIFLYILCRVDPWITWIRMAQIHLYVNFFQYYTIQD